MVCIKTYVFVIIITVAVRFVELKTSNDYSANLIVKTNKVFNAHDLSSKELEENNTESDYKCSTGEQCIEFEECTQAFHNYYYKRKYPRLCRKLDKKEYLICCKNGTQLQTEETAKSNVDSTKCQANEKCIFVEECLQSTNNISLGNSESCGFNENTLLICCKTSTSNMDYILNPGIRYNGSFSETQDFIPIVQDRFSFIPIPSGKRTSNNTETTPGTYIKCNSKESCIAFEDCLEVAENYHKKSIYPQICGHNETTSFVCCTGNINPSSINSSYINAELCDSKDCSQVHGKSDESDTSISIELDAIVFDTDAEQNHDYKCNSEEGCVEFEECPEVMHNYYCQRQYPRLCHTYQNKTVYSICCKSNYITKPRGLDEIKSSGMSKVMCSDCKNIQHKRVRRRSKLALAGGYDVQFLSEVPHMVMLGYEANSTIHWGGCAGTLINEYFVLTAAHCLYARELGNVKFVSIGSLDLNKVNASDQYQVVNQTKHPGYHPPSFYNDIGLLKLDRPVVFTNSIRPACLAVKETITDSQVYTSGWGQTSFGASLSATLQRVKLQIVSAEQCSRSYVADKRRLKYGIQSDMQICAGSPDNVKRDACKGDSGGPLDTMEENTFYVVGVTSAGQFCGISSSPGIYTKVFNYIEWIETVAWENDLQ